MPITFEEVTAEVAPEPSVAAPTPEAQGANAAPDELSEKVQALLLLRAERLQRIAAD